MKKILFLGYDRDKTSLIEVLEKKNCFVTYKKGKIDKIDFNNFDLVISFGYRYIIKKKFIVSSNIPIINLHISYLPWNKGSHPNFWSFINNTPKGVTIHEIDKKIDMGVVVFRKKINFRLNLSVEGGLGWIQDL